MNKLEKDLIRDEGMELKPYRCSSDKLTIGVGRNLEDNGITEAEAMHLLRNDIKRTQTELQKYGWYRSLDSTRQDAMINMCFNLGLPTLLKFEKMIAAIELGDYEEAAEQMLDSRWAEQVGGRAVRLARIMRG